MPNSSVFMIGWEYPPHNSGGLGVACEGLTKALADQNTEIYFTLPYHHSQSISHMQVIDCIDPSWAIDSHSPPFKAYTLVIRKAGKTRFDADELQALPNSQLEQRVEQYRDLVMDQTQLHTKNFDVVHAHDWMTFPAAAQTKNELHKPFIAHVHSTEFDRIPMGNGSPFIHQTEYDGLQQADQIIAVSDYTKHLLVEKYLINPSKITVIHNGAQVLEQPVGRVETQQFAAYRPVVVFMGRLTMQKGPDYFIRLAHQILLSMPQALFIVAGDGDMYQQLLVSTASQGLSAKVLFSGFLRGKDRETLLDRADIFVMPSLSEPFGLVAIEAAQRQTPVIVSKTAGVSEVMPSAIAIDFWDTQLMAQTVKKLLQNRPAHQILVKKQLRDVAQTTWPKAAIDVKQVYRKAFLG